MINFENLHKLLTFLEENKGMVSPRFDMCHFIKNKELVIEIEKHHYPHSFYNDIINHCGTSCCMVGWAPFAGIELESNEGWMEYCSRVFMPVQDDGKFEFLFGSDWLNIDNSIECAILRLKYFIAKKGDITEVCKFIGPYYVNMHKRENWQEWLTEQLKEL